MDLIDKPIIDRTSRAIKCLAFNSNFYKDIQKQGLSAEKVFQMKSQYISNSLFSFRNSEKVEDAFRWLIVIGVLRREVDGQGLTSKVRLTPLGRRVLESKPYLFSEKANVLAKLKNWFSRKFYFQ